MNSRGFTLIETVVSLAILAIMATFVAGIFSSAAAKADENLRTTREKELVLAKIETVIARGISSAPPELEQEKSGVTIDFGGNKINAEGVYLKGYYGDQKLPAKYFYTDLQ